jgi:hypothetical protein
VMRMLAPAKVAVREKMRSPRRETVFFVSVAAI